MSSTTQLIAICYLNTDCQSYTNLAITKKVIGIKQTTNKSNSTNNVPQDTYTNVHLQWSVLTSKHSNYYSPDTDSVMAVALHNEPLHDH